MSLKEIVAKLTALKDKLQTSPLYPDRKVINETVSGLATALLVTLGLSASPLVGALAAVLVGALVGYLSKPDVADIARRAPTAVVRADRVKL